MSKHVSIPSAEAADRLAIKLVEAYAHCADRRDACGQMSLFTEDTHGMRETVDERSEKQARNA